MKVDSIQLSPRPTVTVGMSHPEPIPVESGQSLFSLIPKNSWKGHRCFIIGGGPSVLTHNLDRLAGELTIGVNRAYDIYYPSILCALDPQFYSWAEDGTFGIFSQQKYLSYPGTKAWVQVRKDTKNKASGIYSIPFINWKGNNSGQAAIELAIELGASPIYLIGFDLKGTPTNFHDGYPVGASMNVYEGFIDSIEKQIPDKAKEHGVEVINLSPDSELQTFPFANYDQVLDVKPVRPVIISYFEDGDEFEASELVRSAMLYGLECDVVHIRNTGYDMKQFIKSMLDKHRRPVIYVDYDIKIGKYPEPFDDCKENIIDFYELLDINALFVNYTETAIKQLEDMEI